MAKFLRRKTTPPQPPLTYAPKEHFPEKVPDASASWPSRRRRGAARRARRRARARRRDRVWGARRRDTRGASRDRRGGSQLSAGCRVSHHSQRHRYESRFSLERVKRGRAFRGSSARGRLPERRGRMLTTFSVERRRRTRRRRTWKRARPEWRPALFLGGRDEPRAVVAGPARGVASPSFLQTRVANSPRPSRSERGTRRGADAASARSGAVSELTMPSISERARAMYMSMPSPPRFSLGSSKSASTDVAGNGDADAPETRASSDAETRAETRASITPSAGASLPSHHSRHPSGVSDITVDSDEGSEGGNETDVSEATAALEAERDREMYRTMSPSGRKPRRTRASGEEGVDAHGRDRRRAPAAGGRPDDLVGELHAVPRRRRRRDGFGVRVRILPRRIPSPNHPSRTTPPRTRRDLSLPTPPTTTRTRTWTSRRRWTREWARRWTR